MGEGVEIGIEIGKISVLAGNTYFLTRILENLF